MILRNLLPPPFLSSSLHLPFPVVGEQGGEGAHCCIWSVEWLSIISSACLHGTLTFLC